MAEKLVGIDIAPPDLHAKITGRAKYAEDFRAPGMVFAKLLLSPMPNARVRSVDVSRALAMPGVIDVLRESEVPPREGPREACLTDNPRYEGEPILAVAAVDEETAAAAIEAATETTASTNGLTRLTVILHIPRNDAAGIQYILRL